MSNIGNREDEGNVNLLHKKKKKVHITYILVGLPKEKQSKTTRLVFIPCPKRRNTSQILLKINKQTNETFRKIKKKSGVWRMTSSIILLQR